MKKIKELEELIDEAFYLATKDQSIEEIESKLQEIVSKQMDQIKRVRRERVQTPRGRFIEEVRKILTENSTSTLWFDGTSSNSTYYVTGNTDVILGKIAKLFDKEFTISNNEG